MSERESFDEKAGSKAGSVDVMEVGGKHHVAFRNDQVDTAAQLVAGEALDLDPAEAERIRKKIDWHILPLMCSTFPVFFHTIDTERCFSIVLDSVHGQDDVG